MSQDDQQGRVDELATEWSTPLRRTGHVRVRFATESQRDLYRRAGRKAGRILGRPVRTVVTGDQVHVMLDDWMDNPLERQVEDPRTRKAIDAAFAHAANEPEPPIASVTELRPQRPCAD
ncbi:hypothetical protein GCM10010191_68020 [Actinomadura vinacea]|uniref:Uncharacterized protein n=1 Tax=Actinomadura vinacea TaxID=115336 RepID=A0ABP5X4L6_9ACTN